MKYPVRRVFTRKSESNWIEVMDMKIFLEELNVLFGKSANEIIDNEIAVYVKKWIWNDE